MNREQDLLQGIVTAQDNIRTAKAEGAYAAAQEYREDLIWLEQQLVEVRKQKRRNRNA